MIQILRDLFKPRRRDRGLTSMWTVRLLDERGRLLHRERGPNIQHDEGHRYLLGQTFGRDGAYTPVVHLEDGVYTQADKKLVDGDSSSAFQYVSVGMWIYLQGGYHAGGESATGGYYEVATKVSANEITLTADPAGVTGNITGGISSSEIFPVRPILCPPAVDATGNQLVDGSLAYGAGPPVTYTLTDADTGAFANLVAGDWIYLQGGYHADGQSVINGWYRLASKTSDSIILLTTNPAGGILSITGGICSPMFYAHRPNIKLGLDMRTTIDEKQTMIHAFNAELPATSTGYARQRIDPNFMSYWTVQYDSTYGRYVSASLSASFTNSGSVAWPAAKNLFFAVDDDAVMPSGDILIGSKAFDEAIAVPSGKTLTMSGEIFFREEEE